MILDASIPAGKRGDVLNFTNRCDMPLNTIQRLIAQVAPFIKTLVLENCNLGLPFSASSPSLKLRVPRGDSFSLSQSHSFSIADTLPTAVTELPNLERLYVGRNRRRGLPDGITLLQGLRVLSLPGNELQSLPASLTSLLRLEELDVVRSSSIIMQLLSPSSRF